MKLFIVKSIIFSLLVFGFFFWICAQADGTADSFYIRFTTPPQKSLIIGTSRAAQGIRPEVINFYMPESQIFNYAFTIAHSPFGPAYLRSIKRKLDPNSQEGIYIVTVDPWSISSICANPNDSNEFRELELCVARTRFVNLNPNIPYLFNFYDEHYFQLIKPTSSNFLHLDGWLEVNVPMDTISISERRKNKVAHYREALPNYKLSSLRADYLKKTIQFLKTHGDVYLVRLPVHSEIIQIESELMPEFDSIMSTITPMANGYLDMTMRNNDFQYTDGNHLYKDAGSEVSKIIAEWMIWQKKNFSHEQVELSN